MEKKRKEILSGQTYMTVDSEPLSLVIKPLVKRNFEHAIGIDTGCVYGNKLSAIIFEKGAKEPLVISVNSRDMYMRPDLPLQN